MPRIFAVIMSLVGGFLGSPEFAVAEIAMGESIECILQRCDRIVVGKVSAIEVIAGPDHVARQIIRVDIDETLKGPSAEKVRLALAPGRWAGYAERWLTEGISMVFCFRDSDELPRHGQVKNYDAVLSEAILLGESQHRWTGCTDVLTRDFEVLTEKEQILDHLRKTLEATKSDPPRKFHTVDVPWGTPVQKRLYSRSTVFLIVPIDPELESLGRRWSKSEASSDRIESALILQYFKDDENVAILKSFLSDESNGEATMGRSSPTGKEMILVYRKKIFPVRQAAYVALRRLGVTVEKPVIEVLIEGQDEAVVDDFERDSSQE